MFLDDLLLHTPGIVPTTPAHLAQVCDMTGSENRNNTQVYEPDRMWLLCLLVLLDVLLLVVHGYDNMPTMYTIVMGRLTFITLMNLSLGYAFGVLKDRLEEYTQVGLS